MRKNPDPLLGLEASLIRTLVEGGAGPVGLAADTGVQPRDFASPGHAGIFKTILSLWEKGAPVNRDSVSASLNGTAKFLARILEAAQGLQTDEIPETARMIKDRAALRRLASGASMVARMASNPGADPGQVVDRAQKALIDAVSGTGDGPLSMEEALERHLARPEGGRAFSTGFPPLDGIVQGLRPGALFLVAGRTGQGKTTFLANVGAKVAVRSRRPALFVSREQTEDDLAGMVAHILLGGPAPWKDEEAERIKKSPLFWCRYPESGERPPRFIRSRARAVRARAGLDLVLVDHVQLLAADQRPEEISLVSQGLKALAMDLDVAVVAASQLNRSIDYRETKKPMLADLRGSGSLEQDADVVIFLHYPEEDGFAGEKKGTTRVELLVAKNRRGPRGKVSVTFDRRSLAFSPR